VAEVLPSLRERFRVPELMDRPDLARGEHLRALRGLARLNRWSRAGRPYRPVLVAAARRLGGRPVRLLDVATGGGDVPVGLVRWAAARGIELRVTLVDASDRALAVARERAARAGVAVETVQRDVIREGLPGSFDVVTCSLFLHHLSREQAVDALGRMGAAAGTVMAVSDLRRTHRGLALAWAASRALCGSRVVRTDAVRSVRAAFTIAEARALARAAGLAGCRAVRVWPQRLLLVWWRP